MQRLSWALWCRRIKADRIGIFIFAQQPSRALTKSVTDAPTRAATDGPRRETRRLGRFFAGAELRSSCGASQEHLRHRITMSDSSQSSVAAGAVPVPAVVTAIAATDAASPACAATVVTTAKAAAAPATATGPVQAAIPIGSGSLQRFSLSQVQGLSAGNPALQARMSSLLKEVRAAAPARAAPARLAADARRARA